MSNKILDFENQFGEELTERELLFINGGSWIGDIGYAIGWVVGTVFGTIVNAVKLFTGNL